MTYRCMCGALRERGPHALVDVDQRVDQHEGLQPVPPADRDRREPGPRVVGAAEERDRQDDEAEHQPDVARLEAGAEDQAEAGHGDARQRHERQDDPPVQRQVGLARRARARPRRSAARWRRTGRPGPRPTAPWRSPPARSGRAPGPGPRSRRVKPNSCAMARAIDCTPWNMTEIPTTPGTRMVANADSAAGPCRRRCPARSSGRRTGRRSTAGTAG